MLNDYQDIRSRIAEPPRWFDEHGVPRYGQFFPHHAADIYADECALVMIACQDCGQEFMVAFAASQHRTWSRRGMGDETSFNAAKNAIAAAIRDGSLHYGDPPNTGCCPAGPTMSCLDLMVIEYWRLNDIHQWERLRELEISLPDSPDYQEADKQA